MTLANNTSFEALALPYIEADGAEVVVAIVKATFTQASDHEPEPMLADVQSPVRTNDVLHDPDADQSSVRFPSDAGTFKHGVDVVVTGHAIAHSPVEAKDVCVTIGSHSVPLRVHGERVFYEGAGGLAFSPAAAFERRAITYELATGGTSHDFSAVELQNPVGRGVVADGDSLVGKPAPCVEHPAHPLDPDNLSDTPAGYGAIGSHWQPRAGFAGTFDDTWRKTRMPLMPTDFDRRYHNVAHPWMQLAALEKSMRVAVLGMSETGSMEMLIPSPRVIVRGKRDDGVVMSGHPTIDTVLLEPEKRRLELTMRHVLPKGRGRTLLREVQIDDV